MKEMNVMNMAMVADSQRGLRVPVSLALAIVALVGCSKPSPTSESDFTETQSTEARVGALFQSVIDGVQLIESSDRLTKVTGEVDDSVDPPRYQVLYEGCLDGFAAGSFCVRDGVHVIEIVAPESHIIRSVEQTYVFDGFGSVPDYTMTGSLYSYVEVSVDAAAKTTEVEGLASGSVAVSGALSGEVGVELEIGGGRNYTESAATPIVVTGAMTHDGKSYPVDGGFLRE